MTGAKTPAQDSLNSVLRIETSVSSSAKWALGSPPWPRDARTLVEAAALPPSYSLNHLRSLGPSGPARPSAPTP